LEFSDSKNLENKIKKLCMQLNAAIDPGENVVIKKLRSELTNYFTGKCKIFETPIHMNGTLFQKQVWQQLCEIPVSETRSYLQVAKAVSAPAASRAVARANATNKLAIIIPCHRVINSNNTLGGYSAGVTRKQWLLEHEKQFAIRT
jgi:AraC family transcriptional regulator of adaptative response/methylated-DNA-[protein]-cysteine methyltransferase